MSVGSSQGTFSELYDLNEELQNELKYGRRRPYNSSPNMVSCMTLSGVFSDLSGLL